jgi:hypothetical protein
VPRHPPNALTSLTTKTVASLRCSHSFEPLRQMAKLSHTSTSRPLPLPRPDGLGSSGQQFRRHTARVVRCGDHPIHDACSSQSWDIASSTISFLTSSSGLSRDGHRARSCFTLRSSIRLSSVPVRDQLAVGQERFELSTPRLSSVCSNQLSYWPVG